MPDRTSLADRVFETIETRGVEPKPRWHFLLHEWVVWGVTGVSFVVGSIATALTLYIVEASFITEQHIAHTDLGRLVGMLPWIWLLLIVVAILYGVYAFSTTERGYRWQTGYVVALALVLSICVGYGLHRSGLSEAIDRYLIAEVALYRPMSGFYAAHWMNVSEGRWVGVITEEVGQDVFVLHALDGEVWNVHVSDETVFRGMEELQDRMRVRVVGTTTADGMCEAYEVRPFQGRGGMRREHAMQEQVLMISF
ncbi:MAG: hypothetical protein KBD21_04615 [Candidatus Pacebacteria bacterium]|nr:hypothetical protein [Candidatus Paceibacterota bacterium]